MFGFWGEIRSADHVVEEVSGNAEFLAVVSEMVSHVRVFGPCIVWNEPEPAVGIVFMVGDVDGVFNHAACNHGGGEKEGAGVGENEMKNSLHGDCHIKYEVDTGANSDPLVHKHMVA